VSVETAPVVVKPHAGFEASIVPLLKPLLAYFVRRVQPREESADCLSETLVVLWRRRADLPIDPVELRAFAFGVAKGVLANHVRGRVRQSALGDRVRDEVRVSGQPSAEESAVEALQALPEKDRELVTLIVWDGFGVAEAGALLGIRPGAARSRYARAKERLRVILESCGV
jgi:RNA polymerase sigma-70 factor (ECF subfamily)